MAHCPVAPLQQSVLRGKQREGSVKVALYFYNTPVNRCWFALVDIMRSISTAREA
jgi:hypothetical protein